MRRFGILALALALCGASACDDDSPTSPTGSGPIVFTVDLAASNQTAASITGGEGRPESLFGRRVTENLFGLLGAPAALGRTIVPSDRDDAANVVVISDGLWRRRFGAMFEEIMRAYRPREPLDVDQLADMVSTVLEGGIILSKALKQPESLPQQLLVLRSFVRLLFQPATA